MPDETVATERTVEVPLSDSDSTNTEQTPPSGSEQDDGEHNPRKRRRRGRRGGRGSDNAKGDAASSPESSDEAPAKAKSSPSKESAPIDSSTMKRLFSDSSFADLGLRNSVLKGVEDQGFTSPTHIQSEMIPLVLAGRDVLGQSRTGTGKTAAFGLPLFHLAKRSTPFQSIVLAPTRELAIQIAGELSEFGKHTPIRVTPVFGGQAIKRQQDELAKGPEIIVATPGRLMDMLDRGNLHLNNISFIVLDEVDRMLDIGFREDIRKILGAIKTEHQTILVSATISDEIEKLAKKYMNDPARVDSSGGALTVELVEQYFLPVQRWDKKRLLVHLLIHEEPHLTLVFCATKRMVDDLTKHLSSKNIDVRSIHGDMPQSKRNAVMKHFRTGGLGVVIASDVAARGLDVDSISHVVNYDIPQDPEVYVHRIGRTARAGQRGTAWTFVTAQEGDLLTAVEKLANIEIPILNYPTFSPSPMPERMRRRKEEDEKKASDASPPPPSRNLAAAPAKIDLSKDAARFPGGIVPSKMPPKMMGGRVRTSRSSVKQPMLPPAEGSSEKK
jgi:ATP-dependent RNA helicase DeaD